MAERKVWSEQEDRILKDLVEGRKITKWSQIAKIFCTEFGITNRNGKQCRQRYLNHLASGIKKGEWTLQQEQKLIKLHNRYGNRWAEISRNFQGRTDNCVKNQLYSKLRKAIKYLNDAIEKNMRKRFKLLKTNFIYKLIQMADQKYKSLPAIKKEAFQQSYELKNKILKLQSLEEAIKQQKIVELVCQINKFNKQYKKRIPKKRSHRDFHSSESQELDINQSLDENLEKAKFMPKKGSAETEIQIKISSPLVERKNIWIQNNKSQMIEQIEQNKQSQMIEQNNKPLVIESNNKPLEIEENIKSQIKDQNIKSQIKEQTIKEQKKEQKSGFKVLRKGSVESSASNKMQRLHSLSIQKDSAFQTVLNAIQANRKQEGSDPLNDLFTKVDPFLYGQKNQSKFKTKRSSSIESVPNIMVDMGSAGQTKNNEMKASRLRSFGSIEDSYEFQNEQAKKLSSLEKNFSSKEEVQYWLSNVQ